ncbi:alpha-2-macroglobulin family protein [Anaerobaca lacustris]|uniref:Alpha-2-macroglobulin family protein n=1 Tax=Anaerobaca lacustris TaxID=3044600 RepID=A0AAW6TUQ0_9BACT|nr:alpha-2-macroglobulin family protein [Sedimentisphaerales bacterium M17dextr]
MACKTRFTGLLLLGLLAGAVRAGAVEVMMVVPKTLYSGASASATITAVADRESAAGRVVDVGLRTPEGVVSLVAGATDEVGRFIARFEAPDVSPGAYVLEVRVDGADDLLTSQVQIRRMPVVLIETDKPIYKPGQTIQGRVLVLTNELRPTASDVSVQITDGKGVKIFRKELTTNAFGVAPFDLALASELNYGTWKITAESGAGRGTIDLRVERYVLPRFEVKLDTPRDYFRTDEKIPGTITATYFFGKPVDGAVEISASRYVGVWEEYTRYTAPLAEGQAQFSLPEVRYVSGTPGGAGSGSVQLDVTVTDTSGHQEKTTRLLKIVSSGIEHRLIASSRSFTPGQPYEVLLVAETPDGVPVSVAGQLICEYYSESGDPLSKEGHPLAFEGSTWVTLTAPQKASWALLSSTVRGDDESGQAELYVYSTYSPSDSFVHLSRTARGTVGAGETVAIDVFRTHQATVYYDVFANGRTVWSDAVTGSSIRFQATQQMVPAARVVAYAINPNNEISADTIEFDVVMDHSASLSLGLSAEEVGPGEPVRLSVRSEIQSMIGLAIVDESVYALNEGRLNMQEVFNELEKRFMEPQAETHDQPYSYGARNVFEDAGLQVVTSQGLDVPEGRRIGGLWWWVDPVRRDAGGESPTAPDNDAGLAEVERVRQFFPETWVWMPDLLTEPNGVAVLNLTAPDSITTWRLHAVSTSDNGLGIAESSLRVFQEFFGEPDLPYAVTRGEQFPVRIQVYNYLDVPQVVHVEMIDADWFDLLDLREQQIQVNANSVSSVSFLIQPTKLGRHPLEVRLRSVLRADAVRKEVLVEPQGTRREIVTNGLIRAGETVSLEADMPPYAVPDSQKLLLSITPSLVAQSISGVDDLLGMPYGCGEQNMILFAPNVEVLRYLNATGQLTPEVRAKAEHFITVGYQRQLTFRHQDGAFSAFGESDAEGSLWLTAFVLGTFSAAREVTTIDETILSDAAGWIVSHHLADGSWEPIGFVCHSEMVGGVQGTFALTAFVTIALADYGMVAPHVLGAATQYLRDNLSSVQDDAYALAIAALAFARLGDPTADVALDRLLAIAISEADGLYWRPHSVETTGYVALAMIEREWPQANAAIQWLALQRNSLGGYGSTQDTVVALKALMMAARSQGRSVDLTVTARSADGDALAQFAVSYENFDVLQTAELPLEPGVEIDAVGSGQVRFQLVRRFNVLLSDDSVEKDMTLEVVYDADHVEVDDIVNVTATVRYFGRKDSTGMMIVDVGVPTGFSTVTESLEALVAERLITRYEVAGRKVIFYLDGLERGEQRTLRFQVKARFPVRATIPDSRAYSYYEPDVRAEASGNEITVELAPQQ